jgi:hypothetical protein
VKREQGNVDVHSLEEEMRGTRSCCQEEYVVRFVRNESSLPSGTKPAAVANKVRCCKGGSEARLERQDACQHCKLT